MSRIDPKVPIEESVGGMVELVKEGKTRFISLSEGRDEGRKRRAISAWHCQPDSPLHRRVNCEPD
jgi:aryl-alcohol dehydrogenase-like predicted oxidoreductase